MEVKKVLKVRHYKAGYEVREELREHLEMEVMLKSAYTLDGNYIGDSKTAYFLCKKKGIKPELADTDDNVCTIGYSPKEGKFFGWSHRAIHGFGIGDEVEKGSLCSMSGWTDEYLKEHPGEDKSLPIGFKAKTLEDCRRMAVAFAESVG